MPETSRRKCGGNPNEARISQGGFTPPVSDLISGVPTRLAARGISGMTDVYAMEVYGDLLIPAAWSVK